MPELLLLHPLLAAGDLNERHEVDTPDEGTAIKFGLPLAAKAGKADLKVTVSYGYCREGSGGLCKLGTLTWLVPGVQTALS